MEETPSPPPHHEVSPDGICSTEPRNERPFRHMISIDLTKDEEILIHQDPQDPVVESVEPTEPTSCPTIDVSPAVPSLPSTSPSLHNPEPDPTITSTQSSESDQEMFSLGSTPVGSPVKVLPKSVDTEDEKVKQLIARITRLERDLKDMTTLKDGSDQQLGQCKETMASTIAEMDTMKNQLMHRVMMAESKEKSAKKDMESMVIKYAMSEKSILDAKKGREQAEKSLKSLEKERDILQVRLKALVTEKAQLNAALERNVTEHTSLSKEHEKLKSDHKIVSSKLQLSIDGHEEMKEQVINLSNVLDVMKRELEDNRIRMDREEMRAEEVSLLRDRWVAEVKLKEDAIKEMDEWRDRSKELEESLDSFRHEVTQCKQQRDQWHQDVQVMTSMQQQVTELTQQLNDLTEVNLSLQQKLAQNQADLSSESHKLQQITLDMDKLHDEVKEKDRLIQELTSKVTHLTVSEKKARCLAEEAQNEHRVLQKKQLLAMKELNKEITCSRKKIIQLEEKVSSLQPKEPNDVTLSLTSRTSSSSSLDRMVSSTPLNHQHHPMNGHPMDMGSASSDSNGDLNHQSHSLTQTEAASLPPDLDKQRLVDRILKLQKSLEKRSEKVDFLEDHNHQLIQELKRKTRLIQYYLLREETGALTTKKMDQNKKELLKVGSATVMSSMFKSPNSDSELSLELSREINRKLQAVLEDTLLKNITLKDNISTLGDEIARMSRKNMASSSSMGSFPSSCPSGHKSMASSSSSSSPSPSLSSQNRSIQKH